MTCRIYSMYYFNQTANHQGRTVENKFVFSDVDEDWRDGPWGSRGTKKKLGKEILPLLTDSNLYKEFYNYAVNVLLLENTT